MKEWKTIPEYPMYEVSSEGEIRNRKTGRILKTQIDVHGYKRMTVRKINSKFQLEFIDLLQKLFSRIRIEVLMLIISTAIN